MKKEEIVNVIKKTVESIPNENYKIVVALKLEGYKLKEIAEITGKSYEAVKNYFKRGKACLRKKLQEMGYIVV